MFVNEKSSQSLIIPQTPDDPPAIDLNDEPFLDDMEIDEDELPNSNEDVEMDDPPDGTFSNEPASTIPSKAPPPVALK